MIHNVTMGAIDFDFVGAVAFSEWDVMDIDKAILEGNFIVVEAIRIKQSDDNIEIHDYNVNATNDEFWGALYVSRAKFNLFINQNDKWLKLDNKVLVNKYHFSTGDRKPRYEVLLQADD